MSIFGGRPPDTPEVRAHTPRVVVKFAPTLRLSNSEAAEAEHAALYGPDWEVLRLKFPGVTLRPFFTTLDGATLERLEQRANAAGLSPRLTSYFAIVVAQQADADEVAKEISAWPHVELAYVEGHPVPPPVNASNDPLSPKQGYLSPAPGGIDAHFAWTHADGSGSASSILNRAGRLTMRTFRRRSPSSEPTNNFQVGPDTVPLCLGLLPPLITTRASSESGRKQKCAW